MSILSSQIVNQIAESVGVKVTSEYLGAHKPLIVEHTLCKHTTETTYSYLQKHSKKYTTPFPCNTCKGKVPRTTEQVRKEIKEKYNLELVGEYVSMKAQLEVKASCGHVYTTNTQHLLYSAIGAQCKICSEVSTVRYRFLNNLAENNLTLIDEYKTSQTPVVVLNNKCNHRYTVIPNNLVCAGSGYICRICFPSSNISQSEIEVLNFIKTLYKGPILTSDRTQLAGLEIDIFLPEKSIGIEYNGNYWHQEDKKGSNYHKHKADLAEQKGIQLIQITSDEWEIKSGIVKSRLNALLGSTFSLAARKCVVRELGYFPSKFLTDNHIQGAGTPSSHNYGLYFQSELVAVMTFSKPRFNDNYDFELVRFCSLTGINVIGGASKLFKYFLKQLPGRNVISYADRRWSKGNLYKLMGFEWSHNTQPNYKYYKNNSILTRYSCQKHLLKTKFPEFYNPDLTEKEIMSLAGYYPVYDAGNSVWSFIG
jgi:hypothetical protein